MNKVAKVIEISASSDKSIEDAVKGGLKKASKTLKNVKSAWVNEIRAMTERRRRRDRMARQHARQLPSGLAMTQIARSMVTTTLELPGHRIVRNVGIVRGLTVRSRSIVGNIGAALQSLVGGNITLYAELCEKAREDAFR